MPIKKDDLGLALKGLQALGTADTLEIDLGRAARAISKSVADDLVPVLSSVSKSEDGVLSPADIDVVSKVEKRVGDFENLLNGVAVGDNGGLYASSHLDLARAFAKGGYPKAPPMMQMPEAPMMKPKKDKDKPSAPSQKGHEEQAPESEGVASETEDSFNQPATVNSVGEPSFADPAVDDKKKAKLPPEQKQETTKTKKDETVEKSEGELFPRDMAPRTPPTGRLSSKPKGSAPVPAREGASKVRAKLAKAREAGMARARGLDDEGRCMK